MSSLPGASPLQTCEPAGLQVPFGISPSGRTTAAGGKAKELVAALAELGVVVDELDELPLEQLASTIAALSSAAVTSAARRCAATCSMCPPGLRITLLVCPTVQCCIWRVIREWASEAIRGPLVSSSTAGASTTAAGISSCRILRGPPWPWICQGAVGTPPL